MFESHEIRLSKISQEKGVSNWLTSYHISEHEFDLNKKQFWDGIRIRYRRKFTNRPSICACGHKMNIHHPMSCKKGCFITIRHHDVWDLTSNLLTIIYKDVKVGPKLLPVTGQAFDYKTANTSNEARVDIRARGFWERGQQAFFDLRVFDLNANRYHKTALPQCYIQNKKEKETKLQ